MTGPVVCGENVRAFNPAVRPGLAAAYADALTKALPAAEIGTPIRLRHFMAQLAHESAGFRSLVESLNYTVAQRLVDLFSNVQSLEHAMELIAQGRQAIGCCIYANKLGNGNMASGDGYRFRGRGFIMITGRANYRQVQTHIGEPVEANPGLLAQPETAAKAAALFWRTRGINHAADMDDIEEVTRLVNGNALRGLEDRKRRLAVAWGIWPDQERPGALPLDPAGVSHPGPALT